MKKNDDENMTGMEEDRCVELLPHSADYYDLHELATAFLVRARELGATDERFSGEITFDCFRQESTCVTAVWVAEPTVLGNLWFEPKHNPEGIGSSCRSIVCPECDSYGETRCAMVDVWFGRDLREALLARLYTIAFRNCADDWRESSFLADDDEDY